MVFVGSATRGLIEPELEISAAWIAGHAGTAERDSPVVWFHSEIMMVDVGSQLDDI